MGERSHATSGSSASSAKRVRAALAVGTVALLLGGSAIYLLIQPGSASAESQTSQPRRPASRAANQPAPGATTATGAVAKPGPAFVARINADRVSWQELAEECIARYGEEVLDDLVNQRLIEQECSAKGIRVTSGEIDAEIARQAEMFRVTSENWLKMLEQERDLKPEQYAKYVVWPKLALVKLTKDRIEVTAEDLQKGFEANYGPRVKARMILMSDQRKLTQLWTQAKANPADFGRLARDHSEDPGSRALDGQIQPVAKYSGFDTLWKTAFELKEGELSGVIQVGDRYVVLLCEGRTEPLDITFEEVRNLVHDEIVERKTQSEIAKVFQEIKDHAKIETYLSPAATASGASGAADTPSAPGSPPAATARRATGTQTK
jgi:foldase protein PrsA